MFGPHSEYERKNSKKNKEAELKEMVLSYESSRQTYKEKYEDTLDKPNSELKVSIVIPTFAELSSDNFWRMLRSLMYQRDIKQNEFETIFVINNSEELATLSDKDVILDSNEFEGLSSDKRKQRFKENQDQIKIIKIAKTAQSLSKSGTDPKEIERYILEEAEKQKIELSSYENSLLFRFAKSNVSVQCVDASSVGRGFQVDSDISPIGLARDIGSYFSYDRFKQIHHDGIVDFIDGDCFLPPNYIKSILDLSQKGADFVVKPLKKVVAEVPTQIEDNPRPYIRLMSTVRYLSMVYLHTNYYDDIIKKYRGDGNPIDIHEQLGGPQLSVRSSWLPLAGGYTFKGLSGDWDFSRKTIKANQGKRVMAFEDTCVLMSDRGREISIDGRQRGELSTHSGYKLERESNLVEAGDSAITGLRVDHDQFLKEIDTISSYPKFSHMNLKGQFLEIMEHCFKEDSRRRIQTIEKIGRCLEVLSKFDYKNKKSEEIIDYLYQNGKSKSTDRDFFEQNRSLVDLAVEVMKMSEATADNASDKAVTAMVYLQEILPEYFKVPPSEMPDISDTYGGENIADYDFIREAIYKMRVKLRNVTYDYFANNPDPVSQ